MSYSLREVQKRPGTEWEVGDKVCPRRFAWDGRFVEGEVRAKIPLPSRYTPPGSYEWQDFAYIVEWPEPGPSTPLARGHGIFLGNDLLKQEAGLEAAIKTLKDKKQRLLDDSRIDQRLVQLEGIKHTQK